MSCLSVQCGKLGAIHGCCMTTGAGKGHPEAGEELEPVWHQQPRAGRPQKGRPYVTDAHSGAHTPALLFRNQIVYLTLTLSRALQASSKVPNLLPNPTMLTSYFASCSNRLWSAIFVMRARGLG